MSFVIREIKPVEIGMRCDECGEGMMKMETTAFGAMAVTATLPLLYRHKCDKCGAVKEYDNTYPKVLFWKCGEFREPDPDDLPELMDTMPRC